MYQPKPPRTHDGIERYDSLLFGIAFGILVPFVGYAVLLMINEQIPAWGLEINGSYFKGFSLRLLQVLAICLNLIPFNVFQTRRMNTSMRGVFIPTIIYIMLWMYLHTGELFG